LRLRVEREVPSDDALASAWNNLVAQMERPEVFYTYEWSLAVQGAYPKRFIPLLILGFEEERLAAAVSLAVDREQSDQVVFLTATTADYCDFLSPPEERAAWITAVLGELRRLRFSRMTLANVPAHSSSVAAIQNSARQSGYFQYTRLGYHCAQISFADSKQREVLARRISSKKMLRRNLGAMEKMGGAKLRTATQWQEIEPAIGEFTIAHVGRFLESGRISNLARPERRKFLYELAERFSHHQWLALSRLTLVGKTIAWNYGFQYGGSWFWYQPTFDSDYANLSPGYCLLGKIIEAACQRLDITNIDLGLGDEEYKERFASSSRQILHVSINKSYREHLRSILQYRAGKTARQWPALEEVARSLMFRFRALRRRIHEQSWRAVLLSLASRTWHQLFGQDRVLFFEREFSAQPLQIPDEQSVEPLTLKLLAIAAMHYPEDEETHTYLLRAAQRLAGKSAQGFVLTCRGVPVHFAWITDFEGFHVTELNLVMAAPAKGARLVFDCWTPVSVRGQEYYSHILAALAARLSEQGEKPWIFGAASNQPSLRGIRKAGFEHRFTVTRRRMFGLPRLSRTTFSSIAKIEPYGLEAAAGKIS
jgi:CelD/BcsL family acetyltransferase involved in cellulose biosynthesis